jgi:hypothetical protein
MTMKRSAVFVVAFAALALAPAQPGVARDIEYALIGDPGVVTLVNLHPDEKNRRLYSVNYQLDGLMALCTKVRITAVTHKAMTFELAEGGRKYEYLFHETLPQEGIPKHLDRFFGKSCPRKKADALGSVDRQGITEGRALPGMTRAGVILAIGYPPEHATPSLDSGVWKYWRNRFGTRLIHFEGGKVSRID